MQITVFSFKDRASVYCAYTYANVDSETSVYSAVVEAGTYDIEASYSYYYYDYDDDIDEYVSYNADEYTLSTKYLYAQPLLLPFVTI